MMRTESFDNLTHSTSIRFSQARVQFSILILAFVIKRVFFEWLDQKIKNKLDRGVSR